MGKTFRRGNLLSPENFCNFDLPIFRFAKFGKFAIDEKYFLSSRSIAPRYIAPTTCAYRP
jgi:hypothetical protein